MACDSYIFFITLLITKYYLLMKRIQIHDEFNLSDQDLEKVVGGLDIMPLDYNYCKGACATCIVCDVCVACQACTGCEAYCMICIGMVK